MTTHNTARYSLQRLIDEHERLRAFVEDLANHGLRCDLTPTCEDVLNPWSVVQTYSRMLLLADEQTRERARHALGQD